MSGVVIIFLDNESRSYNKEIVKNLDELITWLRSDSDMPFDVILKNGNCEILYKHAIKTAKLFK